MSLGKVHRAFHGKILCMREQWVPGHSLEGRGLGTKLTWGRPGHKGRSAHWMMTPIYLSTMRGMFTDPSNFCAVNCRLFAGITVGDRQHLLVCQHLQQEVVLCALATDSGRLVTWTLFWSFVPLFSQGPGDGSVSGLSRLLFLIARSTLHK